MAHQEITSEVHDVLTRSRIDGCNLVLPGEQLPRPLYEAVNRALVNAGGKWNRFAKAHVFPSDPRPRLGLMIANGVSRDGKKDFQAFYTPSELADEIAIMACVGGQRVLEPSAGNGALLAACLKFGATQVDCVEIREEERQSLSEKGGTVTIADFLTVKPWRQFSRIVMNPPFTKNQDIKHVEHALRFLAPNGLLVSVMAGNTERPRLQKLIAERGASIREIEAGAFKQSGTNVKTVILSIEGGEHLADQVSPNPAPSSPTLETRGGGN